MWITKKGPHVFNDQYLVWLEYCSGMLLCWNHMWIYQHTVPTTDQPFGCNFGKILNFCALNSKSFIRPLNWNWDSSLDQDRCMSLSWLTPVAVRLWIQNNDTNRLSQLPVFGCLVWYSVNTRKEIRSKWRCSELLTKMTHSDNDILCIWLHVCSTCSLMIACWTMRLISALTVRCGTFCKHDISYDYKLWNTCFQSFRQDISQNSHYN